MKKEINPVKYFAPGWFAIIMGTGGLGNILFKWRIHYPALGVCGIVLAAIALGAYFTFLVPWTVRWFKYPKYVLRDMHSLISVNFFPTMGVATTIIGTNVYNIWSRWLSNIAVWNISLVSWIISCVVVVLCTFYTTYQIFAFESEPDPEMINFAWLMAPIANMALLLIGCPVFDMSLEYAPGASVEIFAVNTAFAGIGFFLFIFVSAIVFVRLARFKLPAAANLPSFGTFLSAVGLAVSAFMGIARNAYALGFIDSTASLDMFAGVIWGFGFWVVGIIMIISVRQYMNGGIPFTLGWWAFIFPMASYTVAAQKIMEIYSSGVTYWWALFLTALLCGLWVFAAVNTVRGIASGVMFSGEPLEE